MTNGPTFVRCSKPSLSTSSHACAISMAHRYGAEQQYTGFAQCVQCAVRIASRTVLLYVSTVREYSTVQ